MEKIFLLFVACSVGLFRLSSGDDLETVKKDSLSLYPFKDEYLAYINIEENVVQKDVHYQTIIVMDRSSSMGLEAQRLVQRIFPLFLENLSYQPTNLIQLITFGTESKLYDVSVKDFPELDVKAGGSRLMKTAIDLCKEVFGALDNRRPVRLLTVSDGEIQDRNETAASAASLNTFLKEFDPSFKINSNAVRLFTSDAQPDARAISSLLQLNNGPRKGLEDILSSESDEVIAEQIADLFKDDNFDRMREISADEKIFKPDSWKDSASSSIALPPGESFFFITKIPESGFKSNGTKVEPIMQTELDAGTVEAFMRKKLSQTVKQLKILKVVDSEENRKVIEKIKEFFQTPTLLTKTPDGQQIISNMAVFKEIERIANDQTVKNMSQKEITDYLNEIIELPPIEKIILPIVSSTTGKVDFSLTVTLAPTEKVTEGSLPVEQVEPQGIWESCKKFWKSIVDFIFSNS